MVYARIFFHTEKHDEPRETRQTPGTSSDRWKGVYTSNSFRDCCVV